MSIPNLYVHFEYEIHAAHMNDGADCSNIRKLDKKTLYKSIHGHNWKISVNIDGKLNDLGIVADEVIVRETVMKFHSTYLPEHPLCIKYMRGGNKGKLYAGGMENVAEAICMEIYHALRKVKYEIDVINVRAYETPTMYAHFTHFPEDR